jgi:predicted GNAT superfamily acetyltransferase
VTIEFRELRTAAEVAPMPVLEARVWGDVQLVAVNLLVATISEGGMAIGAFDGDRLVGSVYGFATQEPHVLHSHYLAVDPDYRRTGLGLQLKHRQREWCVANGRSAMRWTFDPLQLGNAHLNLRSLPGVGVQYHANLYGAMGGINGALPSDRLLIDWQLDRLHSHERPIGDDATIVDVPEVTSDDIATASPAAHDARLRLRDALEPLIRSGWLVTDVDRVARTYTLTR